MNFETIQLTIANGIATLTLNRPRALNALNRQMLEELDLALDNIAHDQQVKVVVLTGARRAFCFGADFEDLSGETTEATVEKFQDMLPRFQNVIRKLYDLPQPAIASLNAFAAGAGLDLALACDIRVATDKVKLSEAFVKMSLVPDGGGTWALQRLIGYARAAELIFTGEPIDATQAERIGLVNRVVPAAELEATVQTLAAQIAAATTAVVRRSKKLMRSNASVSLNEALNNEELAQLDCVADPQFVEMLNKRRS
jgi:2-(1,2-epoxy-1,2-dihydrophenyl)acetyl-CoA isomerase